MSSRRTFIKTSCLACAQFAGLTAVLASLQSCSSIRILETGISGGSIDVPFSSFEPEEHLKIVRVPQQVYDILLVRQPGQTATALLLQCTHEDTRLVATNSGLYCNLHGSSFSLSGDVKAGPAIRRLKQFPVTEHTDHYTIQFNS